MSANGYRGNMTFQSAPAQAGVGNPIVGNPRTGNGMRDADPSGAVGYWIAQGYNVTVIHYASSLHDRGQENADIDNTINGYYQNLLDFAAVPYTFATWQDALNDGFTFDLRPLTPTDSLNAVQSARLIEARFRCYDFTLPDDNNPLAPPFSGVATGGWQPNWFRPKLYIRKNPVVWTDSTKTYFGTNAGDASMGVHELPYCIDGDFQLAASQISQVGVWAPCGRITSNDGDGTIQAYPIVATLYFVLIDQ